MNRQNLHAAGRLYSSFFLLFFILFLVPAAVSVAMSGGPLLDFHSEAWTFIFLALFSLGLGLVLRLVTRVGDTTLQITMRTGFLIATAFWALAAGVGALPFLIGPPNLSFTDAYFETMSGFTTTGGSVIPDVESLGPGLGFWRCMTHWLGGMGIILLFVVVLPSCGVNSFNLYRAERSDGMMGERIKPRIVETAKSLWKIYLFFSGLQCLLLWAAGMSLYDATCHTFSTLATGGFSTKNQGVAAFHSVTIEGIIILFMFIGGTNFALHYRMLHGENTYLKNTEFKVYLLLIIIPSLLISGILLFQSGLGLSLGEAVRQAVFYVVSSLTCSGFTGPGDYVLWPASAQLLLLLAMLIGGCAGSTSGAMKVLRFLIALKVAARELFLAANPRIILPIKNSGQAVGNDAIINIFSFIVLYLGIYLLGTFCLALSGMDMVSSLGGAAAALGNVGPGLGTVGPTATYAPLTPFAKWVLTILMLLGRLELYTVLILLLPWLESAKIYR